VRKKLIPEKFLYDSCQIPAFQRGPHRNQFKFTGKTQDSRKIQRPKEALSRAPHNTLLSN
jgi:hypothetical protein